MPRSYFDFGDMMRMNRDGYFPYTPPMMLIRGLRASVDLLLEEGLANVFARHHRMAEAVRAAVSAWGLDLCARAPRWYSNTVSAILVPNDADAAAVVRHAYERYDICLGVGLARLAGRVFRIGHLGDMNAPLILTGIAGAEMAMCDAGIGVEPGSGVAAAQDYLRRTVSGVNAGADRAAA